MKWVNTMLFLEQWEPILYFNGDTLEKQIFLLQNKRKQSVEDLQKIKFMEFGVQGEKGVLFELQNSHMSMYILHDVNIKYNDNQAQIDFLVITEKNVYILECKNLYGNIEIDSHGNFIREINWNGKTSKTGIYNPVTQVKRHVDLLKHMLYQKYGLIKKLFFRSTLDEIFIPIVVLANEKTILKDRYAPKEIKDRIIRKDQLIQFIKQKEKQRQRIFYSKKSMEEFCSSLLKYQVKEKIREEKEDIQKEIILETEKLEENKEMLRAKLKKYRLEKSRKENCQAYIIFNDKTLEDILKKCPKTLEELLKVEGFGAKKIEKYGEEILKIIKE